MASGTLCQLCGRPSGDQATACVTCAQKASQALLWVAEWLADDLVTATARQTALGGGRSGGKPTKASEAPLPLDLRASEALAVLRNTLSGWVRVIADDHHGSHPTNTVKAMARWLVPVIGWARGQEYGPELIDEIQAAVGQALAAVDRPIRRVPLHTTCRHITLDGQTPRVCGGQLHAVIAPGHHADGHVRCETDREHTTTVTAFTDRRRGARLTRLDISA